MARNILLILLVISINIVLIKASETCQVRYYNDNNVDNNGNVSACYCLFGWRNSTKCLEAYNYFMKELSSPEKKEMGGCNFLIKGTSYYSTFNSRCVDIGGVYFGEDWNHDKGNIDESCDA